MSASGSDNDNALAGRAFIGPATVVGTLVFAFLVVLGEQVGVPPAFSFYLTGLLLICAVVITAAQTRTMSVSDWLLAGRNAGAVTNAMAMSAGLISGWILVMLGGFFFADPVAAMVWLMAPLLALAVASMLVAPYLRTSGAVTPAGFVELRFTNRWPALALAAVSVCVGVLLLWGHLVVAGAMAKALWGFDHRSAILVVAILCAISVLPGGLRGMIRLNALIFAFLATAYLAPLIWPSLTLTGFPIPQLSFGYGALEDVRAVEEQLRGLGVGLFDSQVGGVVPASGEFGAAVATLLVLALGLAAMPFLLGHFAAASGAGRTRVTAGWTMLYVAIVLTAAPALAAFAKLGLYNNLLGLKVSDIQGGADWMLAWARDAALSGEGTMTALCGQSVTDTAAAIAACGGNDQYVIAPPDVELAAETVTLAFGQIIGLPTVLGAMIGAAVLAASLAGANAVTVALAATIGRDLLGQDEDKPRPATRVLFVCRLASVAVLALAAALSIRLAVPAIDLMLWAVAISAAIMAPVVLGAIWWDRFNLFGALAGIVGSGLVLAAIAALTLIGPDMQPGSGDEGSLSLPVLASLPAPLQAGFIALAAMLVLMAAGSYAKRLMPSRDVVAAIRMPDRDPAIRGPDY